MGRKVVGAWGIATASVTVCVLCGCTAATNRAAWGNRTRGQNRVYRVDGHDDTRLVYRESGPADAPLQLLFLHGATCSKYAWAGTAARLTNRYRTILLDLLGHGDSSKPADHDYTMVEQSRIVCDFICDKGLDRIVLIGSSYGGGVALETAKTFATEHAANPIVGLVLVAPAAYTFPPPPEFLDLTSWWMPLVLDLAPSRAVMNYSVWARYYDPKRCTPESRLEYERIFGDRAARKTGRTAMLTAMVELERRQDEMHYFKTIDCPVLLMWGQFDQIVHPIVMDKLRFGLGRTPECVVLPNAGHAVCEECPEQAIPPIADFLDRLSSIAPAPTPVQASASR